MKDLLLYVADADAQAFLNALLNKPLALGIRQITYDIERHPLRDSGMVHSGCELARMKKGKYHKAILTLDYHGSGRDHKQSAEELQGEIQNKLNDYTWRNNSSVIIFVPELEQWLWCFEYIVRERLKTTISPRDFEEIGERASIHRLLGCASFQFIVNLLRTWFPQ